MSLRGMYGLAWQFTHPACLPLCIYIAEMLRWFAEQLNEFVGAMPVYGDVNDILETSMSRMKVSYLMH